MVAFPALHLPAHFASTLVLVLVLTFQPSAGRPIISPHSTHYLNNPSKTLWESSLFCPACQQLACLFQFCISKSIVPCVLLEQILHQQAQARLKQSYRAGYRHSRGGRSSHGSQTSYKTGRLNIVRLSLEVLLTMEPRAGLGVFLPTERP